MYSYVKDIQEVHTRDIKETKVFEQRSLWKFNFASEYGAECRWTLSKFDLRAASKRFISYVRARNDPKSMYLELR